MNIITYYPLLSCLLKLLVKAIIFTAGIVVIGSWILAATITHLFDVR